MPAPSATSGRTTATAPVSGELVSSLEAQLAALRIERDQLKAQLDQVTVTKAGTAFAVPFPAKPADYHEAIISVVNTRLDNNQRLALRALFDGLYTASAKTKDGKPVFLPVHAVHWLLEQLTFAKVG
ncbi:MAG: hypothetical protein RL030_2796 [Pseudomonadota bacterium]|jgi:hypothetical protein